MSDLLHNSLIVGSILLLFSVLVSKFSNKFGLPILVLFLGIGCIAGSQGILGIEFENYELTHSLSLVAICLIIFSGGLLTRMDDVKPVFKSGALLSSVAIIITTLIIGVFCHYVLDVAWYESFLIGSILSATDAAAVFTSFRDKNAQVSRKLRSVLEFESGSNDPIAYLLVTIFLGLYQHKLQMDSNLIKMLFLNPFLGIVGGLIAFSLFNTVNNYIKLDYQGLYPALLIGFLFLGYSATTKCQGNGFLAVYVFAIKLGNAKVLHKKALVSFFDGVSWLAQIGLFILLGLLVFPSRLLNVAPMGAVIALALIFAARPIAVFTSLAFSKFDFKEKLFISWAGLKGATPIVFASLAATELGSEANLIFDVVFFSVLISALLQGTTLKLVAKKLDLLFEAIEDPDFPIDMEALEKTRHGIKELVVRPGDFAVGKRIVDLKLPKGTSVLFIKRQGKFILPDGSSDFEELDKVLIATPRKEDIFESIAYFKYEQEVETVNSLSEIEDLETKAEEIKTLLAS